MGSSRLPELARVDGEVRTIRLTGVKFISISKYGNQSSSARKWPTLSPQTMAKKSLATIASCFWAASIDSALLFSESTSKAQILPLGCFTGNRMFPVSERTEFLFS
jgi:hypothetical protein